MTAKTEAVEVIGVVGKYGGGGGRSQGEQWQLNVKFSHWRVTGGPIEKCGLYVYRDCTESEINPWSKRIPPGAMLRVRVRFTESIDPNLRRAILLEYMGKDQKDKELCSTALDRRPDTISDHFFRKLTLDRSADSYHAKHKWMGRIVKITFEARGDKELAKLLRKAERLWLDEVDMDRRVRYCAATHLLKTKNISWLEDGEKLITKDKFIARLKLDAIYFYDDSTFNFLFDDADLFWGHSVVVRGTVDKGPQDAEIEG